VDPLTAAAGFTNSLNVWLRSLAAPAAVRCPVPAPISRRATPNAVHINGAAAGESDECLPIPNHDDNSDPKPVATESGTAATDAAVITGTGQAATSRPASGAPAPVSAVSILDDTARTGLRT
jgi:hypothetical protein